MLPRSPKAFYLINLVDNDVRLHGATKELKKAGIANVRRVVGVRGKSIPHNAYRDMVEPAELENAAGPMRKEHAANNLGSLGCYLSHAKAWCLFASLIEVEEDDYCLIFEDDIALPEDFLDKLRWVISHSPPHWNLLVLGRYGLHMGTRGKVNVDGTIWLKPHRWTCLNVYAVKKSFVRFLLANCFPARMQVDWFVSQWGESHDLFVLETPVATLSALCLSSDINHTPVYWEPDHQTVIRRPVDVAVREKTYRTLLSSSLLSSISPSNVDFKVGLTPDQVALLSKRLNINEVGLEVHHLDVYQAVLHSSDFPVADVTVSSSQAPRKRSMVMRALDPLGVVDPNDNVGMWVLCSVIFACLLLAFTASIWVEHNRRLG